MTISLCITSYDKDMHFIPRLLSEFKNQTRQPDETILLCSGIKRIDDYHGIKTITIPQRIMQSKARNMCGNLAQGDIVVFFDVDDLPHCQKLEITEHVFKKYDPDFMLHNYRNKQSLDLNRKIDVSSLIIKHNLEPSTLNSNVICENYPIHHAHISVKRKVFEKVSFNEDKKYYRSEDGVFCQDLIKANYKGIYIPVELIQYN